MKFKALLFLRSHFNWFGQQYQPFHTLSLNKSCYFSTSNIRVFFLRIKLKNFRPVNRTAKLGDDSDEKIKIKIEMNAPTKTKTKMLLNASMNKRYFHLTNTCRVFFYFPTLYLLIKNRHF